MADNDSSQIKNPVTGAMVFGLSGAAVTAIGAAIRKNNVHTEAMSVLVGGVITGAIAGSVGCCITGDHAGLPFKLQLGLSLIETSLALAASLTAPLMGDLVMGYDNKWGRVIVDGLIGDATVIGGAVGVVAAGATLYGLGYGACSLGQRVASLGMFSNRNHVNLNTSSVPSINSDAEAVSEVNAGMNNV